MAEEIECDASKANPMGEWRHVVILTDADNTLWDTDDVFVRAQLRLLDSVEAAIGKKLGSSNRLEFVRSFDQSIAAAHHLHLRYPVRMLVCALEAGLKGEEPAEVAEVVIKGRAFSSAISESTIEKILADYFIALKRTPELLPGVSEGLSKAKALAFDVHVITEGRAEIQRRIIEEHGLSAFVTGVSEITKGPEQFLRLRRRYGDCEVVVIGDQPSRDIAPAHAAGCLAVLIPSKFQPLWGRETSKSDADYIADTFLSAITWVVDRGRT